jgi:hypothetical protein
MSGTTDPRLRGSDMVMQVRMLGANARLDWREGKMPGVGASIRDGYMLLRGAEERIVLVNTKDRQATAIPAEMLGMAAGMSMNNALVKFESRGSHFAFDELGAGERILGQATRRVRVRQGGTTEVRILGRRNATRDSSVSEHWIAPAPAGVDAAAMRAFARSFGGGMRRTAPELAAPMDAYDRRFGGSMVLRTVTVVYTTDNRGRETVDTVRMDVTEMSRGPLDASLFAVPDGYQVADMTSAGGGGGAGAAGGAPGARDAAADSAARPTAGDAVKRGLRGMIRRP